jgi:hypothetical protein
MTAKEITSYRQQTGDRDRSGRRSFVLLVATITQTRTTRRQCVPSLRLSFDVHELLETEETLALQVRTLTDGVH